MDQHDLVVALKNLAAELGRTPTRDEFCKSIRNGRMLVAMQFKTYGALVQAAGLSVGTLRKIDNSIFEKNIESHLETFKPSEKRPLIQVSYTPTVIIGDTHFPFIHEPSLQKTLDFIAKFKPKRVVQIGDLYDMLSHSKFPRSQNVYTPKEEMRLGREGAVKMWKAIIEAVPNVECHQILGNHDIRPMKRIIELYPEAELFMDFEKWFKFESVNTLMDTRELLVLDGIAYTHGHRSKLGEHMEYIRQSCIHGHDHKAGIVYKNYGDAVLFEMSAGYLGDPESKALGYMPLKHTHSTHTLGLITEYGPQILIL